MRLLNATKISHFAVACGMVAFLAAPVLSGPADKCEVATANLETKFLEMTVTAGLNRTEYENTFLPRDEWVSFINFAGYQSSALEKLVRDPLRYLLYQIDQNLANGLPSPKRQAYELMASEYIVEYQITKAECPLHGDNTGEEVAWNSVSAPLQILKRVFKRACDDAILPIPKLTQLTEEQLTFSLSQAVRTFRRSLRDYCRDQLGTVAQRALSTGDCIQLYTQSTDTTQYTRAL